MSRAGIVIVTYNSGAEIGACLDAAAATGAEVVVVDNSSSDNTVAEVRRRGVRLIANQENRGFAAAVNQGFRALTTPFVLLLNPDAILQGGIDPLISACELRGSAGAGGKLIGPDGVPQHGFFARGLPTPATLACEALLINRVWPGNPVNRRYRMRDFDDSRLQPVDQPAGALLMIRRDVWEQLGGFDERFHPLWFEDVDFCKRAKDRGLQLYYVPNVRALHVGAHSLSGITVGRKQLYWYGNLLKYSAVHFTVRAHRMVCAAVAIGAAIRMFVGCLGERSLNPVRVYGAVALLAGRRIRCC